MPLEPRPTAWLLISTALLLLTIPGVALFYGGMVRKKNVLNTIGLPLSALIMASLLWLCWWKALSIGPIGPEAGGRPRSSLGRVVAPVTGACADGRARPLAGGRGDR
jgi:ammonia channel protein AmtB